MKYHTTSEAADKLGLTVSIVRRYCRQRRLGTRIGRNWAITQAEITRFRKIPRRRGRNQEKP